MFMILNFSPVCEPVYFLYYTFFTLRYLTFHSLTMLRFRFLLTCIRVSRLRERVAKTTTLRSRDRQTNMCIHEENVPTMPDEFSVVNVCGCSFLYADPSLVSSFLHTRWGSIDVASLAVSGNLS